MVTTPALKLLDDCLIDVAEGRCERFIFSLGPQEGKSQRVSRFFPLWLLLRNPDMRIVIASYEMGMARRWTRQIRNDLLSHPELGLRVRDDTSAAHDWQLDGYKGGLYACGVGGALTGRPADCLAQGTIVITEDGPRTIEEVVCLPSQPATMVASYNSARDTIEFCRVEATRVIDNRRTVKVETESGYSFRCTPDHRIYTANRGYVAAGELLGIDRLISLSGEYERVLLVTDHPSLETVYDIQVERNHNFLAGDITGQIVVSNCLIVDDPVKGRAEADSEAYQQACWDWWTETARTRLAPKAPVVLIMTRWSELDLAGRLISGDDESQWRAINVPALCDTDEDPLGRRHGEYLISSRGRTSAQWRQIQKDVGERAWSALYQGRPAPAEGGMFKRGWWQFDTYPLCYMKSNGAMYAHNMDVLIQSWDMTFKDTTGADYVVGQVWGRRGAEVHLLDQVRDRMDFPATCRAVEALSKKWPQATLKLIEDKANGPAVIAQLRQKVPGMVPVDPKGSKQARASAVAPFVEAGNVFLPSADRSPWVGGFVQEHSAFPTGAHDDQVDAMSQALQRLMLSASATDFLNALKEQQQEGSNVIQLRPA